MQTLLQTLQDHDLGHLKAIAELWGIDLPHGDPAPAASHLAQSMLRPDVAEEIIESLPQAAMEALQSIILHGGRIPLADMRREFGSIRRMGPGKRDREKPWRAPESSTETLWYRGLIATAFADSPSGLREFVFIPTDLSPLLLTSTDSYAQRLSRLPHCVRHRLKLSDKGAKPNRVHLKSIFFSLSSSLHSWGSLS